MADTHNVFIPHRHEDDAYVQRLKDELASRGVDVRDASITSDKPNDAKNVEYIKNEKLAPGIKWAGKILTIVTPDTKNHWWVDWEIEYAASNFDDKLIIGVWAPNAEGCPLPEALEKHAHDLVPWDTDKIIDALNGETHWEQPDGTPRPDPPINRIGCN